MKKLGVMLILIPLTISSCGRVQHKTSEQAVSAETDLRRLLDEANNYEIFGYPMFLEKWQQGLDLARALDDQHSMYQFRNAIGRVYYHVGQYQRALEYYEQALEICRAIRDKGGEGQMLANIGGVYRSLGQYQRALEYYKQALKIKQATGDKRGEAYILGCFGDVYNYMDQYQRSLEYSFQALEMQRALGAKGEEGATLTSIGLCYAQQSEDAKAMEYLQQALEVRRATGSQWGVGITLNIIGVLYDHLGQYQQAYAALQRSVEIHTTLSTMDSLGLALSGLALVETHLKYYEASISHYEQALDVIEQIRAGLQEQGHKLSFMEGRFSYYDEFIDLLQGLHQHYPDQGYDRKALEIFERKQGRVFLEQMGQSGARLFAGLPDAIAQQELELENQFDQTHQQFVAERSKPITEQNKELVQDLEKQEKTLQAEQTALQEQIKTAYPDYYALKYPKPASLVDLQQKILQPGELLLVYNVMEEKTVLWVVNSEMLKMYTLPVNEAELQAKIAALRRMMGVGQDQRTVLFNPATHPDANLPQASYDLYTLLIPEEVRPLLTAPSTLIVIPTGPLYGLPFELLTTVRSAPHYLIEDIPISYLSSASLLKILRDAQARRHAPAQYPLLAFAHPVYRAASDATPNPGQEAQQGIAMDVLRTQAYQDLLRGSFRELPETAEEVAVIAQLLNAPETSDPLQLRERASRANVFAFNDTERLKDYQYVVFSTHGVLPGEINYVTQPALVLSHPENNGYLTMADVFGLQLNAKLVALSACNTGSGEHIRGEGVMGLTRAFMYAGTPAVAVTLWSVESKSAKELDVGMFAHLQQGQSPINALRAIKLQMLRGEKRDKYTYPSYWAPFVLFGDGK